MWSIVYIIVHNLRKRSTLSEFRTNRDAWYISQLSKWKSDHRKAIYQRIWRKDGNILQTGPTLSKKSSWKNLQICAQDERWKEHAKVRVLVWAWVWITLNAVWVWVWHWKPVESSPSGSRMMHHPESESRFYATKVPKKTQNPSKVYGLVWKALGHLRNVTLAKVTKWPLLQ